MGVQSTITETREVGFLVDPEARFVSLVDRGANQIPFRIVKIQKGEGTVMKKVLHELIVPDGISDDEIRSVFSEETAPLLKFDKTREIGKIRLIEQVEREKFDTSSFELVDIDPERGIKGIAGVLKEEEKKGLIAKIFKRSEEQKLAEVIGLSDEAAMDRSARSEFLKNVISPSIEDQLFVAMSNVAGILAQEAWDEKDRRKVISGILDTLKDYLFGVLTISKSDALSVNIYREQKKEPIVEEKRKEEREEQVAQETEVVMKDESVIEEENLEEETDNIVKEESSAAKENVIDDTMNEVKKQMAEIKEELNKLREELRKSMTVSEAVYRSEAKGSVKKNRKENIFKGILDL